jgi:bifunctional non-homologous end joining protein LigD
MRNASKTVNAKPDTSIARYAEKRDFTRTPEPKPAANRQKSAAPIFVVQRHEAARAGLHYDFRLEHNGVLLSWAVPKGPSLDPSHKRMAIHVEDHPLDYANFAGKIEKGYGAGTVEIWDHGTWTPSVDPDVGMQKGHLKFTLQGERLHGQFSLIRMKPRAFSKQEAWLLIKDADDAARKDGDADLPGSTADLAPIPGAIRAALPMAQKPQLCVTEAVPRSGDDWISELKFDGYRLIARIDHGHVRLLTRQGQDWTARMPHLAQAFAKLKLQSAMLDGELVVQRSNGISDFGCLQNALSTGQDRDLLYYAFDLMHLDGWDLRPCRLDDRKSLLRKVSDWKGSLRYSDHHEGDGAELFSLAAKTGLEGIVMKRRDAPYRAGRNASWVKIKNLGRAEFVIIGWTKPAKARIGFAALEIATYDAQGALHYAGGVGTGFSDAVLASLRARLDPLALPEAPELIVSGQKPPRGITWVRPELVAEISFTAWSNDGRLRHPVFLGLREDKPARDVTRDHPAPHEPAARAFPAKTSKIVMAHAPKPAGMDIAGIHISHADRELWPGITKLALAEYWLSMAEVALPGIAHRPLAILRCLDGIQGEQFFQKHRGGFMPAPIRVASSDKQPYLAIDDVSGLIAMAQMSAIELHTWGADEADPLHPDRLVFDLDPGEDVAWTEIVQAAHNIRARLETLGLESFCRTSGGKGLHVVVPLARSADWPTAKVFCRGFAEHVSAEEPKRFLAHTKIADRRGRILIDWLRNGPGATAIASFSPRARPGATVATPLAWQDLTEHLDPKAFTIATLPSHISSRATDPWAEFGRTAQNLPSLTPKRATAARPSSSRIVIARKPKKK